MVLQLAPSVFAAITAPLYALTLPIDWTPWQLGAIAILGFDLVGGVLTNATAAAKRWYHRPGQGCLQHMAFVSMHLFQLGWWRCCFAGEIAYFLWVYPAIYCWQRA